MLREIDDVLCCSSGQCFSACLSRQQQGLRRLSLLPSYLPKTLRRT